MIFVLELKELNCAYILMNALPNFQKLNIILNTYRNTALTELVDSVIFIKKR